VDGNRKKKKKKLVKKKKKKKAKKKAHQHMHTRTYPQHQTSFSPSRYPYTSAPTAARPCVARHAYKGKGNYSKKQ
jgi:hypothetical protein